MTEGQRQKKIDKVKQLIMDDVNYLSDQNDPNRKKETRGRKKKKENEEKEKIPRRKAVGKNRLNWEVKQVETKERAVFLCFLMSVLVHYGYSFVLQKNKKASAIQQTVLIEKVFSLSDLKKSRKKKLYQKRFFKKMKEHGDDEIDKKHGKLIFTFDDAKERVGNKGNENYKRTRAFVVMTNFLMDLIIELFGPNCVEYDPTVEWEDRLDYKRKILSLVIDGQRVELPHIVAIGDFYFQIVIKHALGGVFDKEMVENFGERIENVFEQWVNHSHGMIWGELNYLVNPIEYDFSEIQHQNQIQYNQNEVDYDQHEQNEYEQND